MKPVAYSIIALLCLCTTACVRRTITSRPGWKSSKSDELMTIMPNNKKLEESRIIWFWQDGFHKPKTWKNSDNDSETNDASYLPDDTSSN